MKTEGDLSWGCSGPTTPERFGRPGPPEGAAPRNFYPRNSGRRARPRDGSADLPKGIPKDPKRSQSQPKPLRALETRPRGPESKVKFLGGIPTVAASSRLTLRRRMRRPVMMILPSSPLSPFPNTACTPMSATVLLAGAVKTSLLLPGSLAQLPGEHCVCPVLRLGSIRWRELRCAAQ